MTKIDDSVKKKVPELRFKGFTDDWKQCKFSNLAEVRRGLTYKPSDVQKYGIRVLRSSNIAEDTFLIKSDDVFVNKEAVKIDKVKNGDILITSANGSSRLVGKHALIEGIENDTVHGGFMLVARAEKPEFVNAIMSSSWYSKFINIFVSGGNGAIGNLSKSNLEDQKVYVPSEIEQTKIGLFFKGLDDTIALHQRKLDLLKEQKKGYLQKMFPKTGEKIPELRFAGFADDWEERKLGDTLTELKSGLSRMLSNNDIGLPVVRANNINDGQFNIDSDVKYWYVNDPQGANTVNYLIRKNDILINFINSEAKMGTATIVENTPIRDTIYTTNILRARLKKEYDSYYWFALTQINQYKINIKIITKPAVNQASFTTVDFKKLNFMFPNLKEQQKIGSFFKQLDDTIALHQRKLDLLKEQKKGFLQKMFV